MKEITHEWVRLAENDFFSAEQLFEKSDRNPYEVVCFLCQQSAEKYLKGILVEHDIEFEKTHRLGRLLNLLTPVTSNLELHREALIELSNFASEVRYPGEQRVSRKMALDALSLIKDLREAFLIELNVS